MTRLGSGAVIVTLACIAIVAKANAEPLLTISCESPKGFSMELGIPNERLNATASKQPPKPIREPTEDGYVNAPTFIVDSDRKNITAFWNASTDDQEARKQVGLPHLPPLVSNAIIVLFLNDQIQAIRVDPWEIVTYSFFLTEGTAFISETSGHTTSKNIRQMATVARCGFSWRHGRPE